MTALIATVLLLVTSCQSAVLNSDRPRNFSLALLYHTAQQTDGHVVISPFGIWSLMSGVALGATGNTFDELQRAFLFPRNGQKLINGYKELTSAVLNPKSSDVTLTSKNFMFLDMSFFINQEFKSIIQTDFQAAVKTLDFADPASAAKNANSYIQNSGAKVSNVLTSDDFSESRMILTNVISFKGLWGLPFNKTDTTEEPFFNDKGAEIGKVNMMYQKAPIPYSNIRPLKAHAAELPYGHDGKYSMLIILPYPKINYLEVYNNFKKFSLQDVFKNLEADVKQFGAEEIDVRIPRFQISTNVVLNKPLNSMGVYEIFEPVRATFGKVTKEPLFVSAIVHKAEIEVSETGTVASASTTADFSDRITSPSFQANRPFIYFVIEKSTTTVIFGGIYSKPSVF